MFTFSAYSTSFLLGFSWFVVCPPSVKFGKEVLVNFIPAELQLRIIIFVGLLETVHGSVIYKQNKKGWGCIK